LCRAYFRTLELQRSGTGRGTARANIVTMSHRISRSTTTSPISSQQHSRICTSAIPSQHLPHVHDRQADLRQAEQTHLLALICRASKQSLHFTPVTLSWHTQPYIYTHIQNAKGLQFPQQEEELYTLVEQKLHLPCLRIQNGY